MSIVPLISSAAGGASARAEGASAAPLGIHARFHSTALQSQISEDTGEGYTSARVLRRFALQSAAKQLLPRERVSTCLRRLIPGRPTVDLLYSPPGGTASYSNLQVCGSVWLCPVCAAKISERRRVELSAALAAVAGGATPARRVLMATFTLQHNKWDNLVLVLSRLKKARTLMLGGRAAVAFRRSYGIVGSVRALELTYGKNGWHCHLHVLYFFDNEVPIIPFEAELKDRWASAVSSVGGYASHQYGCDVRFSDKDIAEYITKFGREPKWTAAHEMSKAVSKIGRGDGDTPMQLLVDYMGGNEKAGQLWFLYANVFKGEHQLYWSRGLRDLLGIAPEKTDLELAEEKDDTAYLLASLTLHQWRVVLGNDARGDLLDVAASGDVDLVWGFLRSLGVTMSAYNAMSEDRYEHWELNPSALGSDLSTLDRVQSGEFTADDIGMRL